LLSPLDVDGGGTPGGGGGTPGGGGGTSGGGGGTPGGSGGTPAGGEGIPGGTELSGSGVIPVSASVLSGCVVSRSSRKNRLLY
jgi:hypothetical protein